LTVAGTVHFVGAGPGDPLLLTRRAARLLREADDVVADRDAADGIGALAPSTAVHHDVGSTPAGPAWSIARIVDLLAARAARGRQVVRVESGDVFVSSHAAEEVAALRARGVTVTTTPGVSSATAAPLASGMVPVPGTTVTMACGDRDTDAAPVDWAALVEPGSTLVVLAGRDLEEIAGRLMAAGVAGSTPAVLVHAATRPGIRVLRTDLAGLGSTHLPPPTTAVIGPMRRAVRFGPDGRRHHERRGTTLGR
jgi:siroheme synthase